MSSGENSGTRVPQPEVNKQFAPSFGAERRTSIVERRTSVGRSGLAAETTWAP
jgi:hypothetical protein